MPVRGTPSPLGVGEGGQGRRPRSPNARAGDSPPSRSRARSCSRRCAGSGMCVHIPCRPRRQCAFSSRRCRRCYTHPYALQPVMALNKVVFPARGADEGDDSLRTPAGTLSTPWAAQNSGNALMSRSGLPRDRRASPVRCRDGLGFTRGNSWVRGYPPTRAPLSPHRRLRICSA